MSKIYTLTPYASAFVIGFVPPYEYEIVRFVVTVAALALGGALSELIKIRIRKRKRK